MDAVVIFWIVVGAVAVRAIQFNVTKSIQNRKHRPKTLSDESPEVQKLLNDVQKIDKEIRSTVAVFGLDAVPVCGGMPVRQLFEYVISEIDSYSFYVDTPPEWQIGSEHLLVRSTRNNSDILFRASRETEASPAYAYSERVPKWFHQWIVGKITLGDWSKLIPEYSQFIFWLSAVMIQITKNRSELGSHWGASEFTENVEKSITDYREAGTWIEPAKFLDQFRPVP